MSCGPTNKPPRSREGGAGHAFPFDVPARPQRPPWTLPITGVAQLIAVCSASILTETLGYAASFSSPWRGKRRVFERRKSFLTDQPQPSTNSDKLSELPSTQRAPPGRSGSVPGMARTLPLLRLCGDAIVGGTVVPQNLPFIRLADVEL